MKVLSTGKQLCWIFWNKCEQGSLKRKFKQRSLNKDILNMEIWTRKFNEQAGFNGHVQTIKFESHIFFLFNLFLVFVVVCWIEDLYTTVNKQGIFSAFSSAFNECQVFAAVFQHGWKVWKCLSFFNTEKPTVVSFAVSTQTAPQVSSFSTSDHRDQTSGESIENQTQANQISQVSHIIIMMRHAWDTHETRKSQWPKKNHNSLDS